MIFKVCSTVIPTMRVSPTLAKILVSFPSATTNPEVLVMPPLAIINSLFKVSTTLPSRDRRHSRMSFWMTWWGAPPHGACHVNPPV